MTEILEAAVVCSNHRIIQAGRDLGTFLVQPLLKAGSATTYDEVPQSFMMCNARSASLFCMFSRKHFTFSFLTRGKKAGMSFLSSALFREMRTLDDCPASHSLRSKSLARAPTDPLRQSPSPALQKILSDPCVDYSLHVPAVRRVSRCRSGVATAQFNELADLEQPAHQTTAARCTWQELAYSSHRRHAALTIHSASVLESSVQPICNVNKQINNKQKQEDRESGHLPDIFKI